MTFSIWEWVKSLFSSTADHKLCPVNPKHRTEKLPARLGGDWYCPICKQTLK